MERGASEGGSSLGSRVVCTSQVNKMLPLLIESHSQLKNATVEEKAPGEGDVEDPKSHPRLQDMRLPW